MGYYCPLNDAKGNDLVLSKIRYTHFSQLQTIDEGYKVEYKSAWDKTLREKHLAKVITSFANTEGGWLFIGVNNDGSVSDIDKARTDYGQQIGQILKSEVSPYPKFETKFVANPENKSRGILVVYIHEGDEPPYICKGTVYVRVGSNKQPVPVSNRTEIDNLVEKRRKNKEKIDKFCVNEIYIDDIKFPYAIVFIYNKSLPISKIIDMYTTKEKAQEFAQEYGYHKWMITSKSIMFFNSGVVSRSSRTAILEICLDGSIKLYLPLMIVPEQVREGLKSGITKHIKDIDLEGFIAVDGFLIHNIAFTMLKNVFSFLIKIKADIGSYTLSIKLYNIRNCYVFFRTEGKEWADYMIEEGFKYSSMDNSASPYWALDMFKQKNVDIKIEYFISHGIFSAFGMMPIDYLLLDNSVRKKIQSTMGEIQKSTDVEYFKKVYGL